MSLYTRYPSLEALVEHLRLLESTPYRYRIRRLYRLNAEWALTYTQSEGHV